jgi:hypothetical protein
MGAFPAAWPSTLPDEKLGLLCNSVYLDLASPYALTISELRINRFELRACQLCWAPSTASCAFFSTMCSGRSREVPSDSITMYKHFAR